MERSSSGTAYAAAHQLIQWKRYKEALTEVEKVLRMDPEDHDAYALCARIYLHMSEYKHALHWAQEALTREPEHEIAWYVRVAVFYETQRDAEFDEALQQALRIDPYEAHYYFLNANKFNKKGKFKEAKEQLLQALELQPETPLYLATLSYVEALLGNDAESRRLDRAAIREDAESSTVLLYLAWAASRRGDYDLQETYMRNAIRLNPESKQFQDEYLESLQRRYVLYRICLWPGKMINKMNKWQIWIAWIIAWFLFKPLILLFILIYVITHWLTKGIVHVRVFGWRRRNS
ncbi:tetratricopeptide repeat protein [Paenibacillus sp. GCM10023248]|uniref:tetratricopeptide repeat protein n=1 Tax=unclassified Paenibacillus TaxID=185978 RepID=UPI002378AEC8|nr:tetratricopeptide repeat protein [Paenibacillus sp. MAHUQ-63]MDD9268186.1 tetratricopeptide repeat protein [Paenibacillus sp. MAHUQ-63]